MKRVVRYLATLYITVELGGGHAPGLAPNSGVRAFDLEFLPALPLPCPPPLAENLEQSSPAAQIPGDEAEGRIGLPECQTAKHSVDEAPLPSHPLPWLQQKKRAGRSLKTEVVQACLTELF